MITVRASAGESAGSRRKQCSALARDARKAHAAAALSLLDESERRRALLHLHDPSASAPLVAARVSAARRAASPRARSLRDSAQPGLSRSAQTITLRSPPRTTPSATKHSHRGARHRRPLRTRTSTVGVPVFADQPRAGAEAAIATGGALASSGRHAAGAAEGGGDLARFSLGPERKDVQGIDSRR